MPDFLKRFDDSGRTPRDIQIDGLRWIDENWGARNIAGNFPVGSGKTAMLRAIQIVTGGHIQNPSNVLIDQNIETYPNVNYLKGKTHYGCTSTGGMISCQDWQEECKETPCLDCPYTESKIAALNEPTFFNPMSYYYLTQDGRFQKPNVLMIDEAHQLPSMALMLAGTRLRRSQYQFPNDVINERVLTVFLTDLEDRLRRLQALYKGDAKRLKEVVRDLTSVRLVRLGIMENPQNYAIWLEKGTYRGRPDTFLNLKPVRPPAYLMRQLTSSNKLIVMSGTLFPTDLQDLFGDAAYRFYDAPSPIPVANRTVHYTPAPFKMNARTDPETAAKYLQQVMKEESSEGQAPNTIIHVSYAWSKKLEPYLAPLGWRFNTPENKAEVLEDFKRKGGIFVAAGCAEGLDLKGDLCRLNIIPWLLFPNRGDPVVAKRATLADGEEWYLLETMKAVIQQTGRSTRDLTDYSKIRICDNNFSWVYRRVKKHLPKSFCESVVGV